MTPEEKRIAKKEAGRKWREEHPGYHTKKVKEWRQNNPLKSIEKQRLWREKKKAEDPGYFCRATTLWRQSHPEQAEALKAKHNNLQTARRRLKSASTKAQIRFNHLSSAGRNFKFLLQEVRRHLAKGRDVGTIAVWMEIPVSRVNLLIAKFNAENQPQTPKED